MFWRNPENYELLTYILHFLSGDDWVFKFTQKDSNTQKMWNLNFSTLNTIFCLYSGGLDSMAGLVYQLQANYSMILAKTLYLSPFVIVLI